jgi:uncharacterized OB-fold protein
MPKQLSTENGTIVDQVMAAMDDVTLPACHSCGRPVDPNWSYCPDCGAELDT